VKYICFLAVHRTAVLVFFPFHFLVGISKLPKRREEKRREEKRREEKRREEKRRGYDGLFEIYSASFF